MLLVMCRSQFHHPWRDKYAASSLRSEVVEQLQGGRESNRIRIVGVVNEPRAGGPFLYLQAMANLRGGTQRKDCVFRRDAYLQAVANATAMLPM